ncbi:MAG: hypothetical protein QM784_16795 [Polyangiaceae bacterium]
MKAYTVGVQALGVQGDRSDPDSAARMQAGRTRKLLSAYYAGTGKKDRVRIVLPTGQYQPRFEPWDDDAAAQTVMMPTLQIEPVQLQGDWAVLPFDGEYVAELLVAALMPFEGLRVCRQGESCAEPAGDSSSAGFRLSVTLVVERARLRLLSILRRTETSERLFTDRFDVRDASIDGLAVLDDYCRAIAPRIADDAMGAISRGSLRELAVGERAADQSLLEFQRSYSHQSLVNAVAGLEAELTRCPTNLRLKLRCAEAHAALFAFDPDTGRDYLDAAEDEVRSVLLASPDSQMAHLVKGQVHFHRREGQAARRELRRAIELNPLSMYPVATAGTLLALMGDWGDGLGIIDEVYGRYPDAPGFFHWRIAPSTSSKMAIRKKRIVVQNYSTVPNCHGHPCSKRCAWPFSVAVTSPVAPLPNFSEYVRIFPSKRGPIYPGFSMPRPWSRRSSGH